MEALKGGEGCVRMGKETELTRKRVEGPYHRVFCFVLFGGGLWMEGIQSVKIPREG